MITGSMLGSGIGEAQGTLTGLHLAPEVLRPNKGSSFTAVAFRAWEGSGKTTMRQRPWRRSTPGTQIDPLNQDPYGNSMDGYETDAC